ncbi:50S ribosomal protein L1 [bacterium]|nr:50S ribosomal protein L1 [bacterium]
MAGKMHRQALEKSKEFSSNSPKETLDAVVKAARVKFDESVDADIVLGIDASKGEQVVRGSVLLPHGTGKKVRVLVFARGEHEAQASAAGADYVGCEDLIEKIESGWMEFDVAVATPDVMGLVGKVARALGPRGLLPNKKVGTVTFDVESIVTDLKKGRVSFRNDKGGVVHAPVGRVSFGADKLNDNLVAFVKAVQSCKPAAAKGKYIKKITVSSTMGIGFPVASEDIVAG